MSFSDVMEKRLLYYINLNKQNLEEVEKSDEAEDVKIQLRRIYNAKIKALQDVYDEFY